ncbi:hypothetical protein [Enhygromyxa salina]|uniref:Alkaline phosphatase n=1 Tax=Enhygromyxa salina TaxID=215803 RepID=A0A2S9YDL9_9BACT|nr:hypothetical protein [Enhygromyxa salina]PRQ03195.1 hypothetical protein ENSA7_53350 [Enhygromyxa salina]
MSIAKPSLIATVSLTSLMCLTGCSSSSDDGAFSGGLEADGTDGGTLSTSTTNTTTNTSGDGDGDTGDGDGDPGDGDGDGDGDDDSGGPNTKFDLGTVGDAGEGTGGPGGPGSCRESEIYGAAGGFPAFEDPAYADFLDKTIAIVTHRVQSGNFGQHLLTIVDISGDPPPPSVNYLAPLYTRPTWNEANFGGRIFGITLDSDGNIYVAPSTVYGATQNTSTIKKIDRLSGEISNFATLPNNGPAMGNLNYDCVSETIYVSNHEDGRIYQLDVYTGDVVSTYHHATGSVTMGPANDPGEPNGSFAPLGERVWAVQSHAGRLYYSVWWEHSQASNQAKNNEVWSVAYASQNGIPDPGTAKKEFDVPNGSGTSMPVSDLSFAHDGWMLIAQRTMYGDMQTSAHQSTTFDYDYINGDWIWQGTNYVVGELMPYSAAGGVDHDFDPGGYVWMTGDALDFYTPEVVYGLQGTPYGGGDINTSTVIDLDQEITQQDKTAYGDVELPIPGDVSPVPPPG